jgi:protein-S-isoprenylcysteine O-methyltransferase Ste14
MVAAFLWLSQPTRLSLLVGIPISLVGLAVRVWASGYLEKNKRLATAGPYAFVRNPLYVASLVVAFGMAIAAKQPLLVLLFAVVFLLIYLPAIELEEQHLRNLFPGYEKYSQQVSMLIPRTRALPSGDRFQARLYFENREYNALLAFAAGVLFLVWKAGLLRS